MTFQHWAGVTAYTAPFGFARCCVFGKQSLPPGLCHPPQLGPQGPSPKRVLLLPKLRRQFAEFLNHSSPARLGILYPPTCVGMGYGHHVSSLLGFSWQHGIDDFAVCRSASRLSVPSSNSHRNPPTRLPGDYHRPGSSILLRPPSVIRQRLGRFASRRKQPQRWRSWTWREHGGTGISTSCASATPLGLALAPDSPWGD